MLIFTNELQTFVFKIQLTTKRDFYILVYYKVEACRNRNKIIYNLLSPCLSPLDFGNIECHWIFFQFRSIKFKKSKNQFDFEIDFCRLHRQ